MFLSEISNIRPDRQELIKNQTYHKSYRKTDLHSVVKQFH